MTTEVRSVSLQNLSHVVGIMNESSRGLSIEYGLTVMRFLWLARHWNFSYEQSLVYYAGERPAALILNCIDPAARDAHCFYWGAAREYWNRRVAMRLLEASCRKLQEAGYTRFHSASIPDRPPERYRSLRFGIDRNLVEMHASAMNLAGETRAFEIRKLGVESLLSLNAAAGEYVHWRQRPSFLAKAAPFFHVFGAFDQGELRAYTVVLPDTAATTLVDLRSAERSAEAGWALLRLIKEEYPAPHTAEIVAEDSYMFGLLTAAGFEVRHRFAAMSRDLTV